MYPSIIERARK